MIAKDGWEQLKRMRAAGMSISESARRADLDRKTVRRCPHRRSGRRTTAIRCFSERHDEAMSGSKALRVPLREIHHRGVGARPSHHAFARGFTKG